MAIEQYTYWSITINNPDENDYLIVQNPNPKYVREMVWTPEVGGEEGTPHIQGWIRLQRNQSQAFVKKIYPRAHLKPCRKDDYNENCHRYAQKNDDTTAGNHHITLNDPLPGSDTILYQVLDQSAERAVGIYPEWSNLWGKYGSQMFMMHELSLKKLDTDHIEREMITEKAGLEKLFISPTYEKMKAKYWREILFRIYTHKQDASSEGIQTCTEEEEGGSSVCEDHEEGSGEETERSSESGSSCSGSSDDQPQSRKQGYRKQGRR